jgi:hypothetical protein
MHRQLDSREHKKNNSRYQERAGLTAVMLGRFGFRARPTNSQSATLGFFSARAE